MCFATLPDSLCTVSRGQAADSAVVRLSQTNTGSSLGHSPSTQTVDRTGSSPGQGQTTVDGDQNTNTIHVPNQAQHQSNTFLDDFSILLFIYLT